MARGNSGRGAVFCAASIFLSFAMPASMLGVVWPDVRTRFGQSLGTLGLVSFLYGASRMSTCASGRFLVRRYGMGNAFIAGMALLAMLCVALSTSPSWPLFLVAVAGVGVASGMLDSVGAAFITNLGDVSRAGFIHGSYGVGATLGPLVVAVVSGWRPALFISALICSSALMVTVRARHSWPPIEHHAQVGDHATRMARNPALLSVALFATFVAIEVTTGQWAHTYLTDSRSLSDRVAAVGVAAFWGGITTGRLVLANRRVAAFADRVGLRVFAIGAVAALLALAILPAVLSVGVLLITGLSLAPIIPALFATTATRIGVQHAQRMAGWQLLAANTGAIAAPSLTGVLVDAIGPGVVVVIATALATAGVPLLVATTRSVSPAVATA